MKVYSTKIPNLKEKRLIVRLVETLMMEVCIYEKGNREKII